MKEHLPCIRILHVMASSGMFALDDMLLKKKNIFSK